MKTLQICVILFLSLGSSAQNRMNRFDNKPLSVTKYDVMMFNSISDTSTKYVIGAIIDSISSKKVNYGLYVYLPPKCKSIDCIISISMQDGSFVEFKPFRFKYELNYIEYKIPSKYIDIMRYGYIDYITLSTKEVFVPCYDIDTRDFFVKFFAGIN